MLAVTQVKHLLAYDVSLVQLVVLDTHVTHCLTGIVATYPTMKPRMLEAPNGYNWHSVGS